MSEVESRVSQALEPAVAEACERVDSGDVKHGDGTSWYQSGVLVALWVVATSAATVFKIVSSGNSKILRMVLGDTGVLVSDRATALKFWAMARRQICWAHLFAQVCGLQRMQRQEQDAG